MAKLIIRTIELDFDSATLPDVAGRIVSAAMNGQATVNGHASPLADAAEPLKLPQPATNGERTETPQASPKRSYRRKKSTSGTRIAAPQAATPVAKPARAGSIIERIEQCLEKYGWLSVSAVAQKTGLEPKQVSMAFYHNLRSDSPRFKFDESDGTYNLTDPPTG